MRYVFYLYGIILCLAIMFTLSMSVDLFDGLLGGVITLTGVLYVLTYKDKTTLTKRGSSSMITWSVITAQLITVLIVKQWLYGFLKHLFESVAHSRAEVLSFLVLLTFVYVVGLIFYRRVN